MSPVASDSASSDRQEIRSLTGIRGAAAVYVVFFHYTLGIRPTNPLNTLLGHGYLAVDLFFMLSGFVMTMTYRDLFRFGAFLPAFRTFLGRRIARIYPLYLLATLCGFWLIWNNWLAGPARAELPASLGLNLMMVQAWFCRASLDTPGWSISAEWAAYLLFPALLSLTFFCRPLWSWCAGVLSVAAITALWFPALGPLPPGEAEHDLAIVVFPFMRCLPDFTLGMLCFQAYGSAAVQRFFARGWTSSAIALATLAALAVPRAELTAVLLFPLFLLCLCEENRAPARFFASPSLHSLGTLSYSIYMVHYLWTGLLGFVRRTATARGLAHAQSYGTVVCLVATFATALLAYRYVELPARRLLQGLFARLTAKKSPPVRLREQVEDLP